MKTFRRKLPAVVLAIALMGAAWPVGAGGRDVPDRQSNDLMGPERPARSTTQPKENACAGARIVSSVTIGGWTFDLVWSEQEGYRLRFSRWPGSDSPQPRSGGASCPAD